MGSAFASEAGASLLSEPHQAQRSTFAKTAKQLLGRLLARVDVDAAADELAQDFVTHRLPPAPDGAAAGSAPLRLLPTSTVALRWPGYARLVVAPADDGAEAAMLVLYATQNPVRRHMEPRAVDDGADDASQEAASDDGGDSDGDAESDDTMGGALPCLRFPMSLAPALRALFAAGTVGVRLSALPGPRGHATAVANMVRGLAAADLVTVIPA